MDRRMMLHAAAALLPLGVTTACSRVAPVQQGGGEFLGRGTLAQRADQIRRAGTGLGWVMQTDGPGRIRGVLNRRSHQAIVEIPFDQQRFTIRHAGSTNLNYDGTQIHRNYNGWVQNLQQAIISQPAT